MSQQIELTPPSGMGMEASDLSMAGKICLVTGATSGIGAVTARELAKRGATVILVGRDRERGEATARSIADLTSNPSVHSLTADLSSQDEVRRVAREYLERFDRLHVLVNNAGAMYELRRESVDGLEMTFALNHFSPFLLTSLLLNTLKASAPARIVTVSSEAHRDVGGIDFEELQATKHKRGFGAYGKSSFTSSLHAFLLPTRHPAFLQYAQSKLANLLFTYELARRLVGTGVTANALHPGFVMTNFMTGNGVFGWFMRRWAGLVGIGVEEGSQTSVYLATSPEVANVSGTYFIKQKPVVSSPASQDEAARLRLWMLSEELTATR